MAVPYHMTQDERRALEASLKAKVLELAADLPSSARQEISFALDDLRLCAFERGVREMGLANLRTSKEAA